MTAHPPEHPHYRRDLGGGLLLRWSTAEDLAGLAELYSFVFRQKADEPPNQRIAAWTGDLISGRHPQIASGDFALVEDRERGRVVAATCLMQQTWDYAGVTFPVGRPEIVASLPEYRNRGLIRAIFELIHARSDRRGDLAQGITGIAYYYRQFGYEYALDLGGSRAIPFSAIPRLAPDTPEPYHLRDATPDDIPLLLRLYDHERAYYGVSSVINPAYWRHTMDGYTPMSGEGWRSHLIIGAEQRPIGYVLTRQLRWGERLGITGLVVEPGVSMLAVLPSVLRALRAHAETLDAWKPDSPPAHTLLLGFGRDHPSYAALGPGQSTYEPPYAWYVRVPDLPRFIRLIAPVLEARLSRSSAAGHTGELRIDFYRGGLQLAFEGGRLTAAEPWQRGHNWEPGGQCGFPPLLFLQLLFGHRRVDDLCLTFADAWADDYARTLLDALFPAQLAWVLPLD